jgi:AraC-like DNA-binding protein
MASANMSHRRPTRPHARNKLEPSESATIACHLLRTARTKGIDIDGLEARFSIPLDRPVEILRRIPLSSSYELWEELFRRGTDPRFPFEAATTPFPESVALFVFVTTSRQVLRDAIEVLITRSPLITDAARFELDVTTQSARVHVISPESADRVGAHASIEFLVGHLIHNIRCATSNRCRPKRVQFAHPDRGSRPVPQPLGFVVFGGLTTFVELDVADLDLPIDVLDGLAEILISRASPPDLVSRVRNAIALSLAASGRVTIAPIARRLGVTTRTLQRQLPRGVTFHGLVQAAQKDLALALVEARPQLPIKEIATRVGFANARAFSRAYRRWTGAQPTKARPR